MAAALVAACNGTTGDNLITFDAFASGAAGASQPFTVSGFSIQLTTATLLIGAVYIDQDATNATGFDTPVCIDTGLYSAQVPGSCCTGGPVNLLSTTPQAFSIGGNGTADVGRTWELWLFDPASGDINTANTAQVVNLQGAATRISDGAVFTFGAIVTINNNRLIPDSDPSQPGLNPICKQRVIQIAGIDLQLFQEGTLSVTVDPRVWFDEGIDFSTLPLVTSAVCQLDANADYGAADYCIPDSNYATGIGALQGQELFTGIHTGGGAAYSVHYAATQ
jgi:hypothetical protein